MKNVALTFNNGKQYLKRNTEKGIDIPQIFRLSKVWKTFRNYNVLQFIF